MTCATLLATFFGGAQLSDINKSIVYQVPASIMSQMSLVQRTTAKACAIRHDIQYRVV